MAGKRKTVKDLNDFMETLEERIRDLEERTKNCVCNQDEHCEGGKSDAKDQEFEERLDLNEKKVEGIKNELEDIKGKVKEKIKEVEILRYDCKKCISKFVSERQLKEHIKENHMKENKCTLCDKKFTEYCQFKKHLKEHGNTKEFRCEDCEQAFYIE